MKWQDDVGCLPARKLISVVVQKRSLYNGARLKVRLEFTWTIRLWDWNVQAIYNVACATFTVS